MKDAAAPGPIALVVDDEPQMRRFLRASLGVHGYRVIEASTATEALMLASSHNPAIILLDLGLPDGDGMAVTRRLREWTQVPIVIISARGMDDDKVAVLDAGADDYLTKPFSVAELLARMRVALRHATPEAVQQTLEFGALHIDLTRRLVARDGVAIHLTPLEYKLLTLLARHAGKVLTHRQILKEVWGPGAVDQPHYVRVHMAELRKKVERNPARPEWLLTEPAVGYRLRGP
jgi:two-component system KDP operon response regulator KdpE